MRKGNLKTKRNPLTGFQELEATPGNVSSTVIPTVPLPAVHAPPVHHQAVAHPVPPVLERQCQPQLVCNGSTSNIMNPTMLSSLAPTYIV